MIFYLFSIHVVKVQKFCVRIYEKGEGKRSTTGDPVGTYGVQLPVGPSDFTDVFRLGIVIMVPDPYGYNLVMYWLFISR